ncbi:MAG: polysaccharide deacetylase family protein, partial [Alicyclobacillus sp.]|nr:polysaccharide deacetylase family protein [Alicyclobacillus sp.]
MPLWLWLVCGVVVCACLYTVVPELLFHVLHAGTLYRGNPDERVVALTFDDGPDPRYTPLFLDVLRSARVRATFFLVGERALSHPDLVRRMAEEGHEVASHSFRHRHHWF